MANDTTSLPANESDVDLAVIEDFLLSKHCTIYGRFYDIQSPDRRRECAQWLYDEIASLVEFADART